MKTTSTRKTSHGHIGIPNMVACREERGGGEREGSWREGEEGGGRRERRAGEGGLEVSYMGGIERGL